MTSQKVHNTELSISTLTDPTAREIQASKLQYLKFDNILNLNVFFVKEISITKNNTDGYSEKQKYFF